MSRKKHLKKIIGMTPMKELWNDDGPLLYQREEFITIEEIQAIMQSVPFRFAVACVGCPLEWIPPEQNFDFWKKILPNLCDDEEGCFLGDYPNGFVYYPSKWKAPSGEVVILLEVDH